MTSIHSGFWLPPPIASEVDSKYKIPTAFMVESRYDGRLQAGRALIDGNDVRFAAKPAQTTGMFRI